MTQPNSSKLRYLLGIRFPVVVLLVDFIILAPLLSLIEQISLLDAYYFTVISITTIGFGDITPMTAAGKIITITIILSTLAIFASIFLTLLYYVNMGVIKEKELSSNRNEQF